MTDNFKLECKNPAYANRLGKITYGNDLSINEDDYLVDFETKDDCYLDGNIIGTTNAKSITINTLDNYELVDGDVNVSVGVKYDDDTTEYINLGKYTIQRENNQQTSQNGQYTGMDYLAKLDDEYVCGITDWTNKSIADVYLDLCNSLGFTPKTLTFINSTLPVYGNPFTNKEKYRDVLSDIAECACSFVELDLNTGNIDLVWVDEEISEKLTKDDYSSLTLNKKYGPVNSLAIKESQIEGENVTQQDDESIETNGETQVGIVDNYFLNTEELRRQALPAIWERIKGFTYYDCSVTTDLGRPFLKSGSKIQIKDNDGNYFETYVLKHTFKYDGAFHSTIESPALTDEETRIKNNYDTPKTKFRRVEVQVDKINGQIESVVEGNNEIQTKLSQVVQDIDSITSTVQITGGSNMINNSVRLFGNSLWTDSETGTVSGGYDQALVGKTVSASKIQLSKATTTTTADNITNIVIGETYTLSFKASNDENTTLRVRLLGNDTIYDQTISESIELQEYTFSFVADTANLVLEISSTSLVDTGTSLITDLMLAKGDKKSWEPASGEISSTVMKFYKLGLIIYGAGSNTAVMLGSQGLDIRDYNGNEIGDRITYFDADGTKTKTLECTEIYEQNLVNKKLNIDSNDVYVRYIKDDRW